MITYYKNGFVVGEDKHSPFRDYNGPTEKKFMASLENKQVP